jgi:hypothetical protein
MTHSILARPEVRVAAGSATESWGVDVEDATFKVRGWTWRERRRLVDSFVHGDVFERDGFIQGLVELLVSPTPEDDEVPVLAAVTLRLLGVDPRARPPSLLASEALLAKRWGWGPAELDPQPAARIDRHLAAIPAMPLKTPGWNRIDVVDDPVEGPEYG